MKAHDKDRYDGRPYVTDTDELLHEIRNLLEEILELLKPRD